MLDIEMTVRLKNIDDTLDGVTGYLNEYLRAISPEDVVSLKITEIESQDLSQKP